MNNILISKNKSYSFVILFTFVLLFPGAAFQSAYSHPLDYDVDSLEQTKSWKLFKECEKVTVTAEITELMMHWNSTTNEQGESFNDYVGIGLSSLSDGEVEVLYKIWEPGHSKSPFISGTYNSNYNKAKAVGSIVEDDWRIDFSQIDTEYMKNNMDGTPVKPIDQAYYNDLSWAGAIKKIPSKIESTSYFDQNGRAQLKTWMSDSHEKYIHVTCRENLKDLLIIYSASEVDNALYTKKHKIDELLGGSTIEDAINTKALAQNGLSEWSEEKFIAGTVDYLVGNIQGEAETFVKDKLVLRATAGEIKTYDALQKGISLLKKEAAEDLGKKFLGKTAVKGVKYVAKSVAALFEGPVGWVLFVVDTAYDVYDFYNMGNDPKNPAREPLGFATTSIPLDKFGDNEEVEFTLTTKRQYESLCAPRILPISDENPNDLSSIAPITSLPLPSSTQPQFTEMDFFNTKYPIPHPSCASMYDDSPQYWLDRWAAEGGNYEERISLGKAIGLLPDNVTTKEQAANYLASTTTSADYAKSLVVEVEPKLAGTMTVTFKVKIEPEKCSEVNLSKSSITPKKMGLSSSDPWDTSIHFISTQDAQPQIPEWIKTNAKWWSNGLISDSEFTKGLEFLIEQKVIKSEHIEILNSNIPTEPSSLELSNSDFVLPDKKQIPIVISGDVVEIKRATPVEVIIEKPDGTTYSAGTFPDKSGIYSHTWNIETNSPQGTYNVIVKYDGVILDEKSFSVSDSSTKNKTDVNIPYWIKNNAKWWADGLIEDSDFSKGLEFLIEEKVITSPKIQIIKTAERISEHEKQNDEIESTTNDKPSHLSEIERLVDELQSLKNNEPILPNTEGLSDNDAKKILKKFQNDYDLWQIHIDKLNRMISKASATTNSPTLQNTPKNPSKNDIPTINSDVVLSELEPYVATPSIISTNDGSAGSKANWSFEYEIGEPAKGFSADFIVDGEKLVLGASKTDNSGKLSFTFDSSYTPGKHTVSVYSLSNEDHIFFFDECNIIEVNVVESSCSDVVNTSQVTRDSYDDPSSTYAIDKTITYHADTSLNKRHKLNPSQINSITASWTFVNNDGTYPRGVAKAFVNSEIDDKILQYLGTGNHVYVEGDRTISAPIIDGVATFVLKDTLGAYGPSRKVDYYFENLDFHASIQLDTIEIVTPHNRNSFVNDDPSAVLCVEKITSDRIITGNVEMEIYDKPIFIDRGYFGSYTAFGKLIYTFTYPDGSDAPVHYTVNANGKEWPDFYIHGNSVTLRCTYDTALNFEITDVVPVYDGVYDGNPLSISPGIRCPN